jgi:hypothetical protein
MNEYSEYARIRMNIIPLIKYNLFDKKIYLVKNTYRFNFKFIKLKLNIGNVLRLSPIIQRLFFLY